MTHDGTSLRQRATGASLDGHSSSPSRTSEIRPGSRGPMRVTESGWTQDRPAPYRRSPAIAHPRRPAPTVFGVIAGERSLRRSDIGVIAGRRPTGASRKRMAVVHPMRVAGRRRDTIALLHISDPPLRERTESPMGRWNGPMLSCRGAVQWSATSAPIRSNQSCDRSARYAPRFAFAAARRLVDQRRPPDRWRLLHDRQRAARRPSHRLSIAHAPERWSADEGRSRLFRSMES